MWSSISIRKDKITEKIELILDLKRLRIHFIFRDNIVMLIFTSKRISILLKTSYIYYNIYNIKYI